MPKYAVKGTHKGIGNRQRTLLYNTYNKGKRMLGRWGGDCKAVGVFILSSIVDAADSVLGYDPFSSLFIRRFFGEPRGGWIILTDLSVTMIHSSMGPGSRTGS